VLTENIELNVTKIMHGIRARKDEIRKLEQDIKNLGSNAEEERRREEEAKKKTKKVSLIESERAKYKRNNKAIIGGVKGRKTSRVGNDDDVSLLRRYHFLSF
jgi:hypothetical protein